MSQETYRATSICAAREIPTGMEVLHFPAGADANSLNDAMPTRCRVPAKLFPHLYEPLSQTAPDLSRHFAAGGAVSLHAPIIDAVAEVTEDGVVPPEFSKNAQFLRPVAKGELLVRYASGILRQSPKSEILDRFIAPR